MLLLENIKIALSAIRSNKIRAFLTMLGVIIGVASVVTLIAMGQGVKSEVADEIESIGSNLLIVLPGRVQLEEGGMGSFAGAAGVSNLTLDDRQAIEEEVVQVESVGALMMLSGSIKHGDKEALPMLVGGEPDLEFLNLYNITAGRFVNDEDKETKRDVVAIGKTVASDLFGEDEPLGKKININKKEFEVIGIMETKSLSNVGIDANSMAVIPITVASEMFETDKLHRILLQVESPEALDETKQQLKDLLLERHEGVEDFSILTQDDILSTLDQVLGLLTALMSGIAAISLVVGGIGIMNIMLVSVTERTREIGIRKALGATYNNILVQFLTEAAVISLIGGVIGVGGAFLASVAITHFSPVTPEISQEAIALAFGISVAIGVLFGVAPAVKAARKDPIDALHYE